MSNKRWLGNAASVTDLWTIPVPTGTIVSQTYSVTINSKSVTYTAGGSDTASVILAGLQAALSSVSTLPPPEFQELTWAVLPAGGPYTSLTGTQNTPGKPTVISISTGGAATFTTPTNTTVATGPNFFDNAQNWSGGVAPVNSDTLIFDNGSVPCKYNINTSLTGITLNVNPGYSGTIGLPLINSNGLTTYNEYRTTSLTFAGGTAVINASNCGRCNLAFGANTTTIRALGIGPRIDPYTPPLLIIGGNGSSELDCSKCDCGVAFYQGTTANFPTVNIGYVSNPVTDVTLILGLGCTLGTVIKNGGNVTVSANATTITQDISGGSLTLTDSVTMTTLNSYSGTIKFGSVGTVGTINLYGSSILTADVDPRGKTVTNPIQVFSSNVTVIDNKKSINSGTLSLATNGCPTVNVQHGGNTTIVFT